MPLSLLDQIKLQSQILIPLVKTLQSELGEDRANATIRKALGDLYRKYGEKWWQQQGEADFSEKMGKTFQMFAEGDALKYEVVKESPQAYEMNDTACKYAEFYKKLYEGASHCDFRYALKKSK